MIVLGADMHKRSHTIAAVAAVSGELLGDKTIPVGDRGFSAALDWADGLDDERVGRWRTAGMSRVPSSGSCLSMASAWSGSRRG